MSGYLTLFNFLHLVERRIKMMFNFFGNHLKIKHVYVMY